MSKRIDLLAELSDEEIQERIAAKEISQKEAVEELLTRHIPSLYRFLISRYSLDEALVNDVVGESALVILEDYTSYDPKKGSFISWAFGIAHNKLREHLRKEGRYVELNLVESDVEGTTQIFGTQDTEEISLESIEYKEFERRALQAVLELSELDRLLFLLKSNYDLTYEDLANILNKASIRGKGVTADALAQRMSRLKARLRDLLEGKQ